MSLLVIGHNEVRRLLPMAECIVVVRDALRALAEGQVHLPIRSVVRPPGSPGLMALMPCRINGPAPVFGVKTVCVFHDNPRLGKDAHQGVVLLVNPQTGEPQAILDAAAITMIRTAAASAVATEALSRPAARELAVIGSGVQARAHVLAMECVRPLERIRVAGRTLESAQRMVDDLAGQVKAELTAVASAQQAVDGAEIVVTATTSPEPVIQRAWLAEGAHVNAVGSSIPSARELDSQTMGEADLYTDRRESLFNESGDYLMALAEGAVTPESVRGELGEVLIGTAPGRSDDRGLTVFKSLGLSVEDLAAAQLVLDRALASGTATQVDF